MKHTFLKIGAFSIATAATAVGSMLLADKSINSLADGKLANGKTKVRKSQGQANNETATAPNVSEAPAYTPASKVEQTLNFTQAPELEVTSGETQSTEAQFTPNFSQAPQVNVAPEYNPAPEIPNKEEQNEKEEILPNINLDEVENIISNFEIENNNISKQEEQVEPAYEPKSEDLIGEPQEVDFNMPFTPARQERPSNDKNTQAEDETFNSFNGLPYAAAGSVSKEDAPKIEMPVQPTMPVTPQMPTQPDIGVVPQMPTMPQMPSQPDIQNVPQMPVAPQVDPVVEIPLQKNNQDNLNADENVHVSYPVSDEPVVIVPEDVYGEEQLKEPEFKFEGNNPEIELTPGPSFSEYKKEAKEPTYGQPIFDEPVKVGKTRVVGNSVVSDEPLNKAIEMVANKFTGVDKNRLVSIMTQDGSGMVFEFSTDFKKNADTLVNVYTTTSNGDVFQPNDAEKLSALNFGRTFINDKTELKDFFQ